MPKVSFVILYVDDPERSAAFYADLLGLPVVESAPTFAMLALPSGMMLGLWSRLTVEPAADGGPGAGEIALTAEDVDAVHADWVKRGLPVLQPPTDMDFGRTFLAADPDRHRLRVFRPAAA